MKKTIKKEHKILKNFLYFTSSLFYLLSAQAMERKDNDFRGHTHCNLGVSKAYKQVEEVQQIQRALSSYGFSPVMQFCNLNNLIQAYEDNLNERRQGALKVDEECFLTQDYVFSTSINPPSTTEPTQQQLKESLVSMPRQAEVIYSTWFNQGLYISLDRASKGKPYEPVPNETLNPFVGSNLGSSLLESPLLGSWFELCALTPQSPEEYEVFTQTNKKFLGSFSKEVPDYPFLIETILEIKEDPSITALNYYQLLSYQALNSFFVDMVKKDAEKFFRLGEILSDRVRQKKGKKNPFDQMKVALAFYFSRPKRELFQNLAPRHYKHIIDIKIPPLPCKLEKLSNRELLLSTYVSLLYGHFDTCFPYLGELRNKKRQLNFYEKQNVAYYSFLTHLGKDHKLIENFENFLKELNSIFMLPWHGKSKAYYNFNYPQYIYLNRLVYSLHLGSKTFFDYPFDEDHLRILLRMVKEFFGEQSRSLYTEHNLLKMKMKRNKNVASILQGLETQSTFIPFEEGQCKVIGGEDDSFAEKEKKTAKDHKKVKKNQKKEQPKPFYMLKTNFTAVIGHSADVDQAFLLSETLQDIKKIEENHSKNSTSLTESSAHTVKNKKRKNRRKKHDQPLLLSGNDGGKDEKESDILSLESASPSSLKEKKEEEKKLEELQAQHLKQEEAARKAKEAAARKAREEAKRKAKEEAERKAREEAERKAKEEAERKAKEEVERKAKEEAERKAKEEAERKAKEEVERKAKEEAERKAKEEAKAARAEIIAKRQERKRLVKEQKRLEREAKEEVERKAKEEVEPKDNFKGLNLPFDEISDEAIQSQIQNFYESYKNLTQYFDDVFFMQIDRNQQLFNRLKHLHGKINSTYNSLSRHPQIHTLPIGFLDRFQGYNDDVFNVENFIAMYYSPLTKPNGDLEKLQKFIENCDNQVDRKLSGLKLSPKLINILKKDEEFQKTIIIAQETMPEWIDFMENTLPAIKRYADNLMGYIARLNFWKRLIVETNNELNRIESQQHYGVQSLLPQATNAIIESQARQIQALKDQLASKGMLIAELVKENNDLKKGIKK